DYAAPFLLIEKGIAVIVAMPAVSAYDIGEFADIVCADGWHFDESGKATFEEREGRSLILTRTKKGEALVQQMIDANTIETEPTTTDAMMVMQPYQAQRKGFVLSRLLAMTVMRKRRPRFRNLALTKNSLRFGIARGAKSMAGMVLRLARGTQTH
ncbi:MAG: Coenzyme F420 hydrogenase/dehydrogenase, beta subunit C-terminal domain, partial [Parvularcula sp.]|nr:Coenzyme F420 hydrogenase/dehydrogenase, beta subunit C-terminal domain [Parvularcula sp.]